MIEDIQNRGPAGIDGAGGAAGANPPKGGAAPAGSASFEDLLMRIQAMEQAGGAAAAGTQGGGAIEDALHHAEDGFVAAMDLRKRLEQAFRRFVDA